MRETKPQNIYLLFIKPDGSCSHTSVLKTKTVNKLNILADKLCVIAFFSPT